ncbi:MAG: PAS domain S-box protein [Desulfobacterales bacterium]|nr:PAS domain S-box protein [Desulfobacterales bacterium]
MIKFRIPDLPETFVETVCEKTYVATYSSPEWTDIPLTDEYQVTFHRVGFHILSAYPKGKISFEGTKALFEVYDRFLKASGLAARPYVEIADYSRITNLPSKKTRIEVADQLLKKSRDSQLIGHFVYNVPKHIQWIYNIGIRLRQPGIPMMALETYDEAISRALTIHTGQKAPKGFFRRIGEKLMPPKGKPSKYTQEILDYIGSINWDARGIQEKEIPDSHPMKSVFNAIAILKADYDHTAHEREMIQKKYKRLFNRIADPILVVSQETHRILDWNRAFLTVYGFSPDELLTMTPGDLHPEYERKRIKENIDKGEANRYTHITKSGKVIEVEVRTDETDYQGQPAYISNIRDITDQNRLEAELREHRDRLETLVKKRTLDLEIEVAERKQTEVKFKTLFEANADAVLLLDKTGIIDCNRAALDLFGCETKEMLLSIRPEDISPRFQENGQPSEQMVMESLAKAFKRGSNQFEWIHRNLKTGLSFPADVLLNHMTLNGKDVLQAVVRDITQRREAEEALRRSEEKYRGMIENMQDVFFRTDMDKKLTMISSSGLRLTGYDTEEQVLGKDIGELFFKNSPAFSGFMAAMAAKGQVSNFELTLSTRDNEAIPVLSSSKYFTDAMDTPMGIEGTITNIREQKEAEEALRLAKQHAESAANTKSEFLANMSHEIRTPMNAILGMGELVLETELNDYQTNLVTTINNEASSLLGIINSILDFSKVEAGRLELENTPFNLRVLFEDLAASFAITAHKKGLEFISFLPPDTPEALTGDPGRLRQVLVNLIGNAIKFTQTGEVFIWADIIDRKENQVWLRFNVRDTGIGIPPKKQAYIFESFAQADGSTTRKYGGTGLGTTISKQLIKIMGGDIGLDSTPGKGSVFWFTLPLKPDRENRDASALRASPGLLAGKKILVVGSNRNTRFVFSSHLRAWGCLPREAETAMDAIAILKEETGFHLVLTDIHMPGLNGFEMVRQVRAIPALANLPVILLTSIGKIGDNRRCRDLDIQGYLIKPIKQQALKTAITAVLTASKTTSSPPVTRHSISDIRRKKIQILLAEDYPANQQVAIRHLMSRGYQVSLAKNGQQALDLFKAKLFNLVLMDIQMPIMDGYEATRRIRAFEKRAKEAWARANPDRAHLFKRTPIIAMTAHAIKGYREKCLAEDMDDFMTKPLKKAPFLEMIASYVDNPEDPKPCPSSETGAVPPAEAASPPPENEEEQFGEGAPLDYKTVLDEFDNDKPFFTDVLKEFLSTMTGQFPVMENAVAEQDFEILRENAHAIKGGAANLLAQDLSSAASAMEEMSKTKNKEGLRSALDQILFEFARLKEFSREI